jgi:hypothetical protein
MRLRRPVENVLRDRVCKAALDRFGVISLQLNLQFDAGWPDRLFLIPGGRPMLLEFKRPGKQPEPLQNHRLETLVNLGYLESIDAGWCDNFEEAMGRIGAHCARAVETARGSDESPALPSGARGGGLVREPRNGENVGGLRGVRVSQTQRRRS